MAIGLLGRKVGMTQIFDDTGKVVPVTAIQLGPCPVLQIRTAEKDGYAAIQLGFADKPRRLASRSQRGQVAKIDSKRSRTRQTAGVEALPKPACEPQKFVREFRTDANGSAPGVEVGQVLTVALFSDVKAVDVTGTSKGRGTSGVMRRHNFQGQRATHGVKKVHRHGGSTGMNSFPHHIFKGKRMAGRYGNEQSTMRNLRVVKVDVENNLLLVWGAVPGPVGGFVTVRQTNKL